MKMSDITIADFWGIERVAPDMNDGKGTSLVLIRNENGAELFGHISSRLTYKEVSYEDGLRDIPASISLSVGRKKEKYFFRI